MVRVRNETDRSRRVRAEYRTTLPNQGQVRFSRVFSVPAGSRREADLVIRPGVLERLRYPGRDSEQPSRNQFEQIYVLWDQETGERLHQQTHQEVRAPPYSKAPTRTSTCGNCLSR